MDKQPEALRLADILAGDYCPDWFYEIGVDEVVAELRRLHAENQGQAERIQDIYKQLNDTEKEVDDLRLSQREAWHYAHQFEQERKQLQAMLDQERTENEALLRQALDALAASDDFLFNYHECEPNNELELDAYGELRGNNYAAIERLMERLK